ncbi:MAG: hypothetical protein J7497_14020 [Chitinophagaceae bacterium]|nr:hypothetical protein [Chitinophagaceae bacterium]
MDQPVFEKSIKKLSRKKLEHIILGLAQYDQVFRLQLIARTTPMMMDEVREFLTIQVEQLRQGNNILTIKFQEDLSRITDSFMEQVKDLLEKQEVKPAAGICFSVIAVVEPLIDEVEDEGDTLQQIIHYAFSLLRTIPQHTTDAHSFAILTGVAHGVRMSIPITNRHYEKAWIEIVDLFRKSCRSAGVINHPVLVEEE